MSDYITIQLQFFLMSILTGVSILIMYDILRIFRRVVKHAWVFVALEDLIFWILCGFLIFIMMYHQNNGIIRGFAIIGMVLGMVVYNQSISTYFVRAVSWTIIQIKKGITKLILFLIKPMRFLIKQIMRFIKFLHRKVTKNRKKKVKTPKVKKPKVKKPQEEGKRLLKKEEKESRIKPKKK